MVNLGHRSLKTWKKPQTVCMARYKIDEREKYVFFVIVANQPFHLGVSFEIHLVPVLYIIVNSNTVSHMVARMSRCLTLMLIDVQFVLIRCKRPTFLFSPWQGNIKKETGCLANIRPQLESVFL